MKREFLMLAHVYKGEHSGMWFLSEKLDGMRAFWDGGFTRGKLVTDVPFANTEKDGRYVSPQRATGLWSRYGKAIQAPDWWLDKLPTGVPLDGELYAGRGGFQALVSTVKKLTPGPEWRDIRYLVFDTPPYRVIFANGEINVPNFRKKFVGLSWPEPAGGPPRPDFQAVNGWLKDRPFWNEVAQLHEQTQLPPRPADLIAERLDRVVSEGGEGLMLRAPTSFWVPQRARTLLKLKPYNDDEATVVGYVWGRETDKGSKLLGLMGALVVSWKGKRFELSGFTDDERRMKTAGTGVVESAFEHGCSHPGEAVPDVFYNPRFPRGSQVTFRYRELTDDGIPKEARYWRTAEGGMIK